MDHKKDDVLGYDIENTDISDTREVTVKCNGKRFRILMELAKGCYGNCSGCSQSIISRNLAPIAFEKLELALAAFIPVINSKEIRTTVVNYGVGDYFIYQPEDLQRLSFITRAFFDQLHTQRNVISLSTSLLSKPDKIEEKARAILSHLHPTQIVFEAVIDPERLEENYDTYVSNLEGLTRIFPFFDVVVNIHTGLTKNQAAVVHRFAQHQKTLNLDIQYAINKDNLQRVAINPDDFEFGARLFELFEQSQELEKITLSVNEAKADANGLVLPMLDKLISDSLNERVLVNIDTGLCYPVGFAFGDILLDERFDHPSIGYVHDGVYHPDPRAHQKMLKHALKNSQKTVCQSCPHQTQCHGSGYGYYQNFSDTVCNNPGRLLFKKADAIFLQN
jgi:hypothetical protein